MEYSVSTLKTNTIQAATGSTVNVASGHKLSGAAGSIVVPGQIIQVVQGILLTQAASTSSSYVDTGLTAIITPKFSSSKILVMVDMMVSHKGGWSGSNVRLLRDGTSIYYGTGTGHNAIYSGNISDGDYWADRLNTVFLDSPATASAVTYKTQMQSLQSRHIGINRSERASATYDAAGASTITLQEIAQ